MKSKLIYLAIAIVIPFALNAQYDFEEVFPDLQGEELLEKLRKEYKPGFVLDYSHARDTLYAKIYNENDTVYGIYTYYGVYLPKGVDPSEYLFDNDINAEHSYPRSKGAKNGNAKSDMHHLFPSKVNVNSDRGSLPFGEINDNQTKNWYFRDVILHNIPQNNIDEYSEATNSYFEPREDKKGNIARALMYFYTMYTDQANAADADFFQNQKETLCNWHFEDPVDSLEWVRTFMIADYQDGKPNPFVLDCSLASRTYCDQISDECKAVDIQEIDKNIVDIGIFPNPAYDMLNIKTGSQVNLSDLEIKIIDILGRQILGKNNFSTINSEQILVRISDLNTGLYVLKIDGVSNNKIVTFTKMFVKK